MPEPARKARRPSLPIAGATPNKRGVAPPTSRAFARRRVLSYLHSRGEEITYLSARELGKRCGASESTVIRAVQSLGYAGYPSYQADVRNERMRRKTTVERFAQAHGPDPVERAFAADVENLRLTWERLERGAIERAAALLAQADRVWVLGLRSSHAVAVLLHHGLSFLGFDAHLLKPGHGDLLDDAGHVAATDLVVAVALPRYTRQTVEACALAHRRGATVVAITDGDDSPLAPMADLVLPVAYRLEGFIESFTAATCLAQALVLAVAETMGPQTLRILEQREALWSEWSIYWNG